MFGSWAGIAREDLKAPSDSFSFSAVSWPRRGCDVGHGTCADGHEVRRLVACPTRPAVRAEVSDRMPGVRSLLVPVERTFGIKILNLKLFDRAGFCSTQLTSSTEVLEVL